MQRLIKLFQSAHKFQLIQVLNYSTAHQKKYWKQQKQLKQAMEFPPGKFFVWQDFKAELSDPEKFVTMAFAFPTQSNRGNQQEKIFLKRIYTEAFNKAKQRLQAKIDKLTINGVAQPGNDPVQLLTAHDVQISDETPNHSLFFGQTENRCEHIKIGGIRYSIVRDAVWLDKVELVLEPLVGCPIMPSCDWKRTSDDVKYHWFVNQSIGPLNIKFVDSPVCPYQVDGWTFRHTGLYYEPLDEDTGKYLAVVVDMGVGIASGAVSPTQIKKPNDMDGEELIFETRQAQHCQQRLEGNRYRVMCYNILAQRYISEGLKKKEQQEQYYAYCPKKFQFDKYRYPLLLREIPGYNADLMFLQEVDVRFQKRFLVPFLQIKDYTCVFNCKANQVNEGLVIAFRNGRFELVENGNYTEKLSNLLQLPDNSDICRFLDTQPETSKVLRDRPTILQVVHLRTKTVPQLNLLCCNIHAHFDPKHEDVKVLQALLSARYIGQLLNNEFKNVSTQVLFAGDFNSVPDSLAIKMLQGDEIKLPHSIVQGGNMFTNFLNSIYNLFYWHGRNLLVKSDGEKLSADGSRPYFPFFQNVAGFFDYTNYTKPVGSKDGFNGCLDYIWAYPRINVERVVPIPSHQLVTQYGALPSKIAPSDHIPVIAEVEFPQRVKF